MNNQLPQTDESPFPVGYHTFHNNKDINFQLNRFYSYGHWTKAETEEIGNAIQKLENWSVTLTELAEQHLADNRPRTAAFCYRAAEFYTLPGDPLKMQLYDRFSELFDESIQSATWINFP